MDEAPIFNYLERHVLAENLPEAAVLGQAAIRDAYKRFIFPAIERELRNEATERAEASHPSSLVTTSKHLLLTPLLKDGWAWTLPTVQAVS